MKRICEVLAFVMLVATVASAQTSTSPQGGAAIYNKAAVCTSATFPNTFVSPTGTIGPPCMNTSGNGQWFTEFLER